MNATGPSDALDLPRSSRAPSLRNDPRLAEGHEILQMIEDAAIPDLDQDHVAPDIGNQFRRGCLAAPLTRRSP